MHGTTMKIYSKLLINQIQKHELIIYGMALSYFKTTEDPLTCPLRFTL